MVTFFARKLFTSLARSRPFTNAASRPITPPALLRLTNHKALCGPVLAVASSFSTSDCGKPSIAPSSFSSPADKAELLKDLEATLGSPISTEPSSPPQQPLVVVISGPSGVGKDAVIKRLQEVRKDIHFVVTATSRAKRPGEVDGEDYHFVTTEDFHSMIERNELLEYAIVYGDYKGIPKKQVRDAMAKGCDVVMRVDVQGAATLRSIIGCSAVFVFLVAENEQALVQRLIGRKTETSDMLLLRIAVARKEMRCLSDFDYVVVNAEGKLEDAVKLIGSIIDAEKVKVRPCEAGKYFFVDKEAGVES